MKCVLPGSGIRAFGKAVYCLSKLGEELYIEGYGNGLALKTVNNARSAYACFLFDRSFFLSYTPSPAAPTENDNAGDAEGVTKCKISNKSCMSVFKSLATLERTMEHCRMKIDEEDSKLIFIFHCRHGIVKTHSLGYQECEVVQAMFDKNQCSNQLKISSRILSDVVSNFPNSLDEVTLNAESAGISVKSYVDDMEDTRVSLTEVALTPSEFDHYQVTKSAALTFCLKELRALLHFTDSIGHPLLLRFESAGRPIIFSVEDDRDYKVDLVLATLLHDDTDIPQQKPSTSTVAASTSMATTQSISQNSRHISSSQLPPIAADDQGGADTSEGREGDMNVGVDEADVEVDDRAGSSHTPRRTSVAFSSDPQFPSGSQFRRSSNSKTLVGGAGRDSILSKDIQASTGPYVSYRHGNSRVGPKTRGRGVSSCNVTRGHSGRPRDEETAAEMVDALFGDDMEEGPEVGHRESMFGYNTELHGGPHPPETTESREHGILEKTGPPSLSQFGHGVLQKSTPRTATSNSATPRNATPHNTMTSYDRTEGDVHADLTDLPDLATPTDSPTDGTYDSSFLPGTPPSKKFKPSSVMFGMDLFPGRDVDAYILAPDSASDSD